MATYASLTTEEQAKLDILLNNIRAWHGEFSTLLKSADQLKTYYQANNISAILTQISPDTEIIPNKGGLASASDLTKSEVDQLIAQLVDILGDASSWTTGFFTDSQKQMRIKAAGLNA